MEHQGVNDADQRILRFPGNLETLELLNVFGKHQAVASIFGGNELQRFNRCLGFFDAERRKLLKLAQGGGADPAKIPAGELNVCFLRRKFEVFQRVLPPERVLVSLLIESSVHWNTANIAGYLQVSECQRQ